LKAPNCDNALAVSAMLTEAMAMIVEWPIANQKPTATGRLPSCISLRVTLSIAAMWSASTAWRRPRPQASSAVPSINGWALNRL